MCIVGGSEMNLLKWLAENWGTILVAGLLLLLVWRATVAMKKGKTGGCSGSCNGCCFESACKSREEKQENRDRQ